MDIQALIAAGATKLFVVHAAEIDISNIKFIIIINNSSSMKTDDKFKEARTRMLKMMKIFNGMNVNIQFDVHITNPYINQTTRKQMPLYIKNVTPSTFDALVTPVFDAEPNGDSPICEILETIYHHRKIDKSGKEYVVILLTDGKIDDVEIGISGFDSFKHIVKACDMRVNVMLCQNDPNITKKYIDLKESNIVTNFNVIENEQVEINKIEKAHDDTWIMNDMDYILLSLFGTWEWFRTLDKITRIENSCNCVIL